MTDTDTDVTQEADDQISRARVREVLINPLQAAGLRRPKGLTERGHADSLTHLVGQLDHMTADNLRTLADVVMDHAALPGAAQGFWPTEVMIKAWAQGLQPRPFRLHRVVVSWLACIEGPKAEAGGWLVPLFRFLRSKHRPPLAGDWHEIRAEADADSRRLSMIADRRARGAMTDEDRQWMAQYQADQSTAQQFVDQGRARRAAEQQQAGQQPVEQEKEGRAA